MYYSSRRIVERIHRAFRFEVILAIGAVPEAVAAARLARDYGCPLVTAVFTADLDRLRHEPGLTAEVRQALGQSHRLATESVKGRDAIVGLRIAPDRVVVDESVPSEIGQVTTTDDRQSPPDPGGAWYAALASATGSRALRTRPVGAERTPTAT
jgi:hypothetical protein